VDYVFYSICCNSPGNPQADSIGKAKQTFEMVGTALFIMPGFRYLGLLFLFLALPLAYESVRRKVKNRVIYVIGTAESFDHKTMKFWMQAKAMGSKLIVGVPGDKQTDMVMNACASTCVDDVIAEAPAKADLMFLEKQDINYVILLAGQTNLVTDEVIAASRCLCIGEDGIARPMKTKEEHKKD
jgi:glycerol-3-phosphate cytidylyltransferase-like family protein